MWLNACFKRRRWMYEGRPATQLSVLCQPDDADELIKVVLSETTTLGVRAHKVDRTILKREVIAVETQFGEINVKVSYLDNSVRDVAPEAADCKRLAAQHDVAWREVYDAARSAGLALAPTASPEIGTNES